MSYPINYPTPQGANVQIFNEGGSTSNWVKPQGASFVWFTLIGAGGGGGGGNLSPSYAGSGGGSGAVTNFMCPAFLIPDALQVNVGSAGTGGIANTNGIAGGNTTVVYQQKNGIGYTLLSANGGSGGNAATSGAQGPSAAGGAAMTANFFTPIGFFQSIAGQNGAAGDTSISASSTTFLMGGSGSAIQYTITGNYGYSSANGYFQMQPVIVSVSPAVKASIPNNNRLYSPVGSGGSGDGANASQAFSGGPGLVVIITW